MANECQISFTSLLVNSCLIGFFIARYFAVRISLLVGARRKGVDSMTVLFAASCFAIAFAPALAIFVKVVANDPLRVILFFLGSFFWLLSVLITGIFAWPFSNKAATPLILLSALVQESARISFFSLLHRAQKDLERVAANGVEVSSLRLSFSTRHVLAVVCGLGIGVTAALFLLVNVLADYSTEGIVGLPAAVLKDKIYTLDASQASFPVFYSASNSLLVLDNVAWTLILWDACHNFVNSLQPRWFVSAAVPIVAHLFNNYISLFFKDHKSATLMGQLFVFLISAFHCYLILRKPVSLASLSKYMGVRQIQPRTSSTN